MGCPPISTVRAFLPPDEVRSKRHANRLAPAGKLLRRQMAVCQGCDDNIGQDCRRRRSGGLGLDLGIASLELHGARTQECDGGRLSLRGGPAAGIVDKGWYLRPLVLDCDQARVWPGERVRSTSRIMSKPEASIGLLFLRQASSSWANAATPGSRNMPM